MSAIKEITDKFETLRRQAQQLVENEPETDPEPPRDILELIQELRIHQVELEIQNEELRRIHQELFDLHTAYENLYEYAPCGYLTISGRGIVTRVNLTGLKLLGAPKHALMHTGLSLFIDDEHQSSYLNALKTAGQTGAKQSVELQLKRTRIPPCLVRADIEADRDKSGGVTQWRVILMDISAQKAAQEEARRLEEQLRQSQKLESLGTLAGGIAHEFNNMLAIIIGNADLMEQNFLPESHIRESIEEIQTAAMRAREVVQQLLTFSRRSGARDAPLEIGAAVREAMKLVRTSTPANIEIRITIADGLPPVLSNITQINQLLINLCSNAADAVGNRDGFVSVAVSLETVDDKCAAIYPALTFGRYVKITVRDNGAGMDEETRGRVFEPYFTTKQFGKGTGIGLAVTHGIVQRHKGWITVESELGKGTLFTILLPACEDRVEEKPPGRIVAPTGDERILFVDDEPSILHLKRKQLEGLGYSVTCCNDPLDALERVRVNADRFDLVITDLSMPRMTGDLLAAEILKVAPEMPVILCTGYSERLTEEEAGHIGIAAFVLKPIERAELALKIRKILNAARRKKRPVEAALQ